MGYYVMVDHILDQGYPLGYFYHVAVHLGYEIMDYYGIVHYELVWDYPHGHFHRVAVHLDYENVGLVHHELDHGYPSYIKWHSQTRAYYGLALLSIFQALPSPTQQ